MPEETVRRGFINDVLRTVAKGGGEVDFVELVCPFVELKQRIGSPSRLEYQKLRSVSLFEQLHADGAFDASYMPKPSLSIDTSLCTPTEAAMEIVGTLKLGRSR